MQENKNKRRKEKINKRHAEITEGKEKKAWRSDL